MLKPLFKSQRGDAFELDRVSAIIHLTQARLPSTPEMRYTGWVVVLMTCVETLIPITAKDYKDIMKRRGEHA